MTQHSTTGGEWEPISDLDSDDYVLGYSWFAAQSEECPERVYFIGRRISHRPGRLLNEWTGRSRAMTHFQPLPSPPAGEQA